MWSSYICANRTPTIKQILFSPDREIQGVDAAEMDICIHVLDKQTGLAAALFLFSMLEFFNFVWRTPSSTCTPRGPKLYTKKNPLSFCYSRMQFCHAMLVITPTEESLGDLLVLTNSVLASNSVEPANTTVVHTYLASQSLQYVSWCPDVSWYVYIIQTLNSERTFWRNVYFCQRRLCAISGTDLFIVFTGTRRCP